MINMFNTTNVVAEFCNNADTLPESAYLIKIEMVDGSSQYVQITKEHAIALGIEFAETVVEPKIEPTETSVYNNCSFQCDNNAQVTEQKPQYNYRIVQPEDLQLIRNTAVPMLSLPRGRPKKRPAEDNEIEVEVVKEVKPVKQIKQVKEVVKEVKVSPPPAKIIKPARTRSGRITRPPVHIAKDFESIVSNETKHPPVEIKRDLSTPTFQPPPKIKDVSKQPIVEPIIRRKRHIPSQYRCSTCKKAYLGRNRMALHLKQYPTHGADINLKMEDCESWSALIDTALKSKEGAKGTKFCNELINVIKNARTLVKYFFKPAKAGMGDYYIDALLATVLHIKEGNYRFSENELCKDISIFSFLEFFDESLADHVLKYDDVLLPKDTHNHIISLGDELNCDKKIENFIQKVENKPELEHKPNVDLHFESDIMDVIKDTDKTSTTKPVDTTSKSNDFNNMMQTVIELIDEKPLSSTNDNKSDFNNMFDNKKSDEHLKKPVKRKPKKQKHKKDNFENILDYLNDTDLPAKTKNDKEIVDKNPKEFVDNFFHDVYLNDHKTKDITTQNKKDFKDIFNYDCNNMIAENKNENSFKNLFDCHKSDKPFGTMFITNLTNQAVVENKSIPDIISVLHEHKDETSKHSYSNGFASENVGSKEGKELDIFRNTINNILSIGASDENMISVITPDGHKSIEKLPEIKHNYELESSHIMLEENKGLFGNKNEDFMMLSDHDDKKKDEFDMHKLLSADISDELILPDPGPVTGILDTSISSDDIMNVDQFVNERFKKITEAELPNSALSLDLPALECFNFHAS